MLAKTALGVVLVAAFAALPANPQDPNEQSCVMVQELTAERPLSRRGSGCDVRLSPASTFKIPHALVALETGVAAADTLEKWDGMKYPRQREWNRDHTIISALRPSVLWLFQRIAARAAKAWNGGKCARDPPARRRLAKREFELEDRCHDNRTVSRQLAGRSPSDRRP